MSFFSKILKGLGFEEDEQKTPKAAKPKEKNKKEKINPNFASFDLKNDVITQTKQTEEPSVENSVLETDNNDTSIPTAGSLEIIKVQNQVEVQNAVNKLKNGEQIIVNMLALSSADLTRSLDFLTGAVYALNKTMQKVDNAIYIIQ